MFTRNCFHLIFTNSSRKVFMTKLTPKQFNFTLSFVTVIVYT